MGFKRSVRLLLVAVAALASVPVSAAVLEHLYQVQITPAEGQSRDDALREASLIMFQRLAGSDLKASKGAVAKALSAPQELMRRIGSVDEGGIRIEFEPEALNTVLAAAGKPVLGRNRPGILFWAVEKGSLGDERLSPVSSWALLLKEAAAHRAVALNFPLGDLQDLSDVSEEDVLQANKQPLKDASERYPSEGTLALTIAGSADSAVLDWTLWLNEKHQSGRASGTPAEAADALMMALASAVFEQYALPAATTGDLTGWQLHVEGIDSVAAYSGLTRMLRQLGSQQQPKLLAIEGNTLLMQIKFPGDEAQLVRMLSLDTRLQRISAPEPKVEPVEVTEPAGDPAPHSENEQLAPDDCRIEPVKPAAAAPAVPTLYFRWRQ